MQATGSSREMTDPYSRYPPPRVFSLSYLSGGRETGITLRFCESQSTQARQGVPQSTGDPPSPPAVEEVLSVAHVCVVCRKCHADPLSLFMCIDLSVWSSMYFEADQPFSDN